MSAGAVAFTAIVVSGVQVAAAVGAFAWLVHKQRILFAASPKPPARQGKEAAQQPVPVIGRQSA